MAVTALVLSLGPDPETVVARLSLRRELSLGELSGSRLPVVLEAEDAREAARLMDALSDEPGVLHVDLVAAEYTGDP